MSLYELRTIDGQSVMARVVGASESDVLNAAKTADLKAAMWALTTRPDLPYGLYDAFADGGGIDAASSSGYEAQITPISLVPSLTSDVPTELGMVISSGCTTTNPAYYSFDADEVSATFTSASTSSGAQYIGFRFNDPQIAYSFRFRVRTTTIAGAPYTFKFQGSLDTTNGLDGTWVDLYSQTGTALTMGAYYTFPIAAPALYRGYRLYVTKVGNNADGALHLSDLRLYRATYEPSVIVPTKTGSAPNPVALVSVVDNASSAPTYAMGLLWLDAKGAPVTDEAEASNAIRLYLSRDNGATWDWLPLADEGQVSGNVRRYACTKKELAATSGTSIKLKLTSHDLGSGAPDFALHGWGCVYDEGA